MYIRTIKFDGFDDLLMGVGDAKRIVAGTLVMGGVMGYLIRGKVQEWRQKRRLAKFRKAVEHDCKVLDNMYLEYTNGRKKVNEDKRARAGKKEKYVTLDNVNGKEL